MKTLLSIFILVQLTFLHANNYSLSFDGVDDYVDIGSSSDADLSTYTLMVWVKTNTFKSYQGIIANGSGTWEPGHAYLLWIPETTYGTDNQYQKVFFSANGISGGSVDGRHVFEDAYDLPLNEWHHITVSMNNEEKTANMYVDGQLFTTRDFTGETLGNPFGNLQFGAWNSGNYVFNGNLYEISIWSTALSQSQIQSYMSTSLSGTETGLVAYWNFNEGTGTTASDATSNSNDGTISGATWSTDVPPTSGGNNALNFDGTDDYASIVELSTAIDNSSITLMGWFKSTSNGEPSIYYEGIFGFRNYPSSSGNYFANMNWTGWTNVPTIEIYGGIPGNIVLTPSDDTWYHLALVFDNTSAVFSTYLDGVQMASNTATNDPIVPSIDLLIGNNIENGNHFFQGYIDDISLWSVALSQENIQSYLSSELNGNETGLVGYWNFNEGTGTTLTDQTSNDNDGTISGASWTGDGAPVTAAVSFPSDGLVAWYPFNGDANDESGNGNHGTVYEATLTDDRNLNPESAYNFDVSDATGWGNQDDVIFVNYSSEFSVDGITLSAWVNPAHKLPPFNDRNLTICSRWTGGSSNEVFRFQIDYLTNELYFLLRATSGAEYSSSGGDVPFYQWSHVVGTYDGENAKLYVNGQLVDTENHDMSLHQGQGNLTIGETEMANGHWLYYSGDLDDIGYWNRALNETEVSQLFSYITTTSALTWSVRAKASLSTYNDNDNYLGVASNASNVFDASYDELEPPAAPGSSISLYFPHAEWDYLLGDNFSTDARPEVALTDTMQVWDFVVKSTDAGEATLTFVYASVPSVPVILENTATGARQTLSNNATYTFTAVADSAHPFRVSIGDTTAPNLTLGASCSGPAILISDSTHTLGWTSTDGFEVDSVLVSFSSDSGTTYSLQASLGTASSYNWTVPDAMVMTGGKLKLKAQDYAGNSKEEVSSYVFAIAGDSLSSAVTAGWTLWGAPINPTSDTMTTNLADDFSGYWVTFDYVDNGYTYNGILKEAEGYWLGADQNATIDVKGTPVDSNFTVSLSQGWELISNPLVLDVNVDSLTFTKNDTTKTHAEAVTAGWVNSIYSYSSSGYVSATTFSPWSGYWMAVLETGVEITYPIHRNGGSRSSRSIENEWMISFDAQVDGGNDGITRIGYAETATDGFDTEHDAVKPPNPPGPEYVSLFIAHPEWNYLLGDKFAKDIRAAVPANGYQEWQLTMESSESDAQLSWTLVNIPDDYEVGYSIDGGQYFDNMRDVSTITISANTEITVRVGSQVLGIGDEPIPTVFALHQNYPNPFNPVTTLRYDLPENGIVTIIIYDMLGRQVKTLINQTQDAGFKSVVWNATNDYGKPVSAGIYLYQIQTGENISTKKMVLLK